MTVLYVLNSLNSGIARTLEYLYRGEKERREREREGERERQKRLHSPFALHAPIQWAM